jgi:hypothetical protein
MKGKRRRVSRSNSQAPSQSCFDYLAAVLD